MKRWPVPLGTRAQSLNVPHLRQSSALLTLDYQGVTPVLRDLFFRHTFGANRDSQFALGANGVHCEK